MSKFARWMHKKIFLAYETGRAHALRGSLASCGNKVSIRPFVVIEAPEHVTIHDNVSIASFVHMWGNGGIEIGPNTMIASHCAIISATHEPDDTDMHASLTLKKVSIGNDVWIGAGAVVFPGVTIGEHAVIGAGAIVNRDVPPYAVVMGSPARVARFKNADPDTIKNPAAE